MVTTFISEKTIDDTRILTEKVGHEYRVTYSLFLTNVTATSKCRKLEDAEWKAWRKYSPACLKYYKKKYLVKISN